ncbi:DUF982 domain-containing protein [Aeromonas diversa]
MRPSTATTVPKPRSVSVSLIQRWPSAKGIKFSKAREVCRKGALCYPKAKSGSSITKRSVSKR